MEFYRENASATSSSPSLLIFLLFLLFLLLSPSPSQAKDSKLTENKEKKLTLNAVERGIGIGITGFHSRWEALTSWAKLAFLNLRPPDSSEWRRSGTGEKMKAATMKSFETSKETVEKTAAAAAKAAGKAVGMTKEKIKKAVSKSERQQDAEL